MTIIILTVRITRRLDSRSDGRLAALLIACSMPLLYWGVAGFETSVCALLTLLAVDRLIQEDAAEWGAGFGTFSLLGLCFVFRPDAAVGIAACAATVLVRLFVTGRVRSAMMLDGVVAMGIICATELWRYTYYGEWVPNTAMLKLGASSTGSCLWYLCRNLPDAIYALLLGSAIFGLASWRERRKFSHLIFLFLPLMNVAYIFYTGGDVFGIGRFFVATLPTAAVGCALLYSRFGRAKPVKWRLVIFGVVFMLSFLKAGQVFANLRRNRIQMRDQYALAEKLRAIVTSRDLVAVAYAGGLPYYAADLRFLDTLGKCDAHIARTVAHDGIPVGHNKWDIDYVMEREPRIIVSGGWVPWSSNAEFERLYVTNVVSLAGNKEVKTFWLRRKE